VCDWSKPGVDQQGTIPWQIYQRADGSIVYGGRALGAAPAGSGWTSAAFGGWRGSKPTAKKPPKPTGVRNGAHVGPGRAGGGAVSGR
jgi:hypothetical protein